MPPVTVDDLHCLEVHRHGAALLPSADDRDPAVAYEVENRHGLSGHRSCGCAVSGSKAFRTSKTCRHLKQLARIRQLFGTGMDGFTEGFWHRLAVIMTDGGAQPLEKVQLLAAGDMAAPSRVVVRAANGDMLLIYTSAGPDSGRLVERCTLSGSAGAVPTRGDVLRHLALLTCTPDEDFLRGKGLRTKRQAFEETFWYRFAYHCHREFGGQGRWLHPAVDETDGTFYLSCKSGGEAPIFHLPVPRLKVKRILEELKDALCNDHGFGVAPLHLDTVFDVKLNQALDLEIVPMLRLIQADGRRTFFRRDDLARYKYGDIYYIRELGMLAEDRYPEPPPALSLEADSLVQSSRVPAFLAANDLSGDLFRLDPSAARLRIMDSFDRIEAVPQALERDWCWLAVTYGDGCQSVSLADLLQAKKDNQRFVATAKGWVDCRAPAFAALDTVLEALGSPARGNGNDALCLPRSEVLRLGVEGGERFTLSGDADKVAALEHLLSLTAMTPMPPPTGLRSPLRRYQQRGSEWLWFLYENGFGGLLCDDMGLGKTHQVMALLAVLRASAIMPDPFLVVCPTSVISHWEQKLAQHAPDLRAAVYHGGDRDLEQTLAIADVLITSYGILRRDQAGLAAPTWAVVVFDEIQQIKNIHTLTYQAAAALKAHMKLGLTGTPIENSLEELKALLDTVVPGYLGGDEVFNTRYRIPIEQQGDTVRRKQLSRIISPFVLRRLKQTVLTELPPKIEDLRTCRLSDEQVKLYRDAIAGRGAQLLRALEQEAAPVPYMHIFALLNLLKQICNHPALVAPAKDPADYREHASGKWELFTELLAESLASGQKVVVYSQYLGMIAIIRQHLLAQQVDCAVLTGASRRRGELIERFNRDPACRVLVGSLKAGGLGIDLVAASVVIHYDRWWNAAREDQATDRVHRIGQTRGVQVFKLMTQGTLEEKINAIIAKKRDLMDSIVQEDDPDLVKTFSRQDLIELLAMPPERQ